MKNQKGFIPIIIILVILLGISGVYLYGTSKSKDIVEAPVPSASPTVNWSTYSNSKHKFTFKIPTNLKVMNEFEYDPQWIRNKNLISGLEIKNGDITVYSFAIFGSNKLSINDWVYKDNMAMPKESVNTSSYSMNGLDIMVYEGNYNKFYLFEKEDKIYSLTTSKTADSEPKQILSTFKFTQ